jgi:hypothetical protein
MLETNFSHALGLHMHQPPGNLALLIDANPWEAEQIIRCYERPTRYAQQYADVGRLHVGFSGILLEQFQDPDIVDRYRHIIDIPAMLDAYRNTPTIELIGMGYFHPIFPLIPEADWAEQLISGRELMAEVFGRAPRGFWPPEMAFSMEMIPALVRAGYEYVVVDGVHVHPEDGITDVFRPYLACHDGDCITVVPRDRDVSNAQESGLDATWFAHEVTHRCRFSPRPHEARLCTTWSDGENGGWFRQTHEGSGFFGHYFSPYMEHVRGGEYPIRPVALSEYLAAHPASAAAHVQTGAWNVGATSGFDLSQWAGSEGQRRGAETVRTLSRRWWALRQAGRSEPDALARARRLVLEAETSCYLFWGDDWLPKLTLLTDAADRLIADMEQRAAAAPATAGKTTPAPASAVAPRPQAPAPTAAPRTQPPSGPQPRPTVAAEPAPEPAPDLGPEATPAPEPEPEPEAARAAEPAPVAAAREDVAPALRPAVQAAVVDPAAASRPADAPPPKTASNAPAQKAVVAAAAGPGKADAAAEAARPGSGSPSASGAAKTKTAKKKKPGSRR